jgi:WD40 repeat protein
MKQLRSIAIMFLLFAGQVSPAPSQEPTDGAGVKKDANEVDRFGDALPEGAYLRLGTVRWSAGEPITVASLSPDGKLFAACGGRAIWLIDAATGQRGRRIDTQAIGARAVAFSPDGNTLVSAGYSQLSFWDVATGQKKPDADMKLQGAGTTEFSFAADGRRLTAGTSFGQQIGLVVWDLEKKITLGPYAAVHNRASAALAPAGKLLATWGNVLGAGRGEWDRTLQVWDVSAAKEVRQLKIESARLPGRRSRLTAKRWPSPGRRR